VCLAVESVEGHLIIITKEPIKTDDDRSSNVQGFVVLCVVSTCFQSSSGSNCDDIGICMYLRKVYSIQFLCNRQKKSNPTKTFGVLYAYASPHSELNRMVSVWITMAGFCV
jgi:hypothetical protein